MNNLRRSKRLGDADREPASLVASQGVGSSKNSTTEVWSNGDEVEADPLGKLRQTIVDDLLSEAQAERAAHLDALDRMTKGLLQVRPSPLGRPAQLRTTGHFSMVGWVREEHFLIFP